MTAISSNVKNEKIKEKAKKYQKDLDIAYGETKPIKIDSPQVKEIKELIISGEITYVDFQDIKTNKNIRREINRDDNFLKLKESVNKNGLLQSLVVEFNQIDSKKYELICVSGHRRLAAYRELFDENKLDPDNFDVPVQIISKKIGTRDSSTEIALSENVHRKNLHFVEVAETYQKLLSEGRDFKEISNLFEKDIRTIKRYTKIANWDEKIKNIIVENPKIFPFKYIWDSFVKTNKYDRTMGALLAKRIQKFNEADQNNRSAGTADRKSTRLNSSHSQQSRMPSSA